MKNTLKIGFMVASVLVMSLAVAGCTSNTSNTSGQALTIAATTTPANATLKNYYGNNVVVVNATITNNNAGTFKISSDNFYLSDSGGYTHQPLNTPNTAMSDSNAYTWMWLYFRLDSGTTPASLRYYDGTHDVSCSVS
jgi:hypothetical protein